MVKSTCQATQFSFFHELGHNLGSVHGSTDSGEDIENRWEVRGEAIQTVMRRYGIPEPYEKLKTLTRGNKITKSILSDFVQSLDIPDHAKNELLNLTPSTYIGLASKLTNLSK